MKEHGNRYNGISAKTIKLNHGEIELAVPRDRKTVVADLKPIYPARTEDEALFALRELAEK